MTYPPKPKCKSSPWKTKWKLSRPKLGVRVRNCELIVLDERDNIDKSTVKRLELYWKGIRIP